MTQAMKMVKVDKRRQAWEEVLVERAVVEEIYSSHSSEEERLQYCSDTYVTAKVNSSWEGLVQKLYNRGEFGSSQESKNFPTKKKVSSS